MRICFFLPGETELARLREVDPDRSPQEFRPAKRVWILQTFLRLREAGMKVTLEDEPSPAANVLVYFAGHSRELLRRGGSFGHPWLVGVRADRNEPRVADFEIVQNGYFADERRSFFIPQWPQPGLVRRDPARGARVAKIGFKGLRRNRHPELASESWNRFLAETGLVDEGRPADYGAGWQDYSDVDVLLALRPEGGNDSRHKPAAKLYNAWAAGVPAVLGDEYPYRELRRSELDYLSVNSVEEAKGALLRLRDDPELYRAMVANGLRRAEELSPAAITERWRRFFLDTIPRLTADRVRRSMHALPLGWRRTVRYVLRRAQLRPLR